MPGSASCCLSRMTPLGVSYGLAGDRPLLDARAWALRSYKGRARPSGPPPEGQVPVLHMSDINSALESISSQVEVNSLPCSIPGSFGFLNRILSLIIKIIHVGNLEEKVSEKKVHVLPIPQPGMILTSLRCPHEGPHLKWHVWLPPPPSRNILSQAFPPAIRQPLKNLLGSCGCDSLPDQTLGLLTQTPQAAARWVG